MTVRDASGAYCESRFSYRRRRALEVAVGEVPLGGAHPIRVQSMTTPQTTDVEATTDQIERLVGAGCEIVRVTVPTRQDAEALPRIRDELRRRRVRVPLVADIHFSPQAALLAVEHVEKVRINPGNYADRKRFEVREYTEAEYASELERVRERFLPLVERARERGVALRIGANHGSLSDRIVNRHGDTPLGMVESALEFVRIAEDVGFREIVLSMKASNPQVMIRAYRLLAARLAERGTPYPFHLGVTEAGAGEDGRVKSAVGIGSLLDDGLGDTVRVSLTEDPVAEIPVARALVEPYNRERAAANGADLEETAGGGLPDPFEFSRRVAMGLSWGKVKVGGDEPPRVEVTVPAPADAAELLRTARRLAAGEAGAEVVVVTVEEARDASVAAHAAGLLRDALPSPSHAATSAGPALAVHLAPRLLREAGATMETLLRAVDRLGITVDDGCPDEPLVDLLARAATAGRPVLLEGRLRPGASFDPPVERLAALAARARDFGVQTAVALHAGPGVPGVPAYRYLAATLSTRGLDLPLVLRDDPGAPGEDALLDPPKRLGSLLVDGLGDALRIEGLGSPERAVRRAYDVLQATRRRISRVDYIACPSCGRTQFDLEEVTRKIQEATGHLKDLKIAVMGCIVNGPGEMADADFGSVGWGPGRVALFVGKACVDRDVPSAEAPDRLVDLIRRHGRWRDVPAGAAS